MSWKPPVYPKKTHCCGCGLPYNPGEDWCEPCCQKFQRDVAIMEFALSVVLCAIAVIVTVLFAYAGRKLLGSAILGLLIEFIAGLIFMRMVTEQYRPYYTKK